MEIGAGPSQPIARTLARDRFLNDKYQVTLVSINPIKERKEAYKYETDKFIEIGNQHAKII